MKVVTTNLLNRFWKSGIKPIMEGVAKKVDTSKIVQSTNITEDGFLMDGKTASEAYAELIGKYIIINVPFTVTSKSASASGYQEVPIPVGTVPDGYFPKVWCVRSSDVSASKGLQLNVMVANASKIWINYYSPNSIAEVQCSAILLCEKE